jgi:hypothetical protein
VWRRSEVIFVGEDGIDAGGLTVEMHSAFWRIIFNANDAGQNLFETSESGTAFLPRAGASLALLEAAGRVLLKSVLDDHPIGGGLSRFVFEFLCDMHECRVISHAHEALETLAQFDSVLSGQWRAYLSMDDVTLVGLEPTLKPNGGVSLSTASI